LCVNYPDLNVRGRSREGDEGREIRFDQEETEEFEKEERE